MFDWGLETEQDGVQVRGYETDFFLSDGVVRIDAPLPGGKMISARASFRSARSAAESKHS